MTSDRSRSRRTVSRQRPVSCTFCRSRKLRCNRDFPCSNCTSRGLPCQQGTVGSSGGRICCQSSSHTAEILARLKRLENIVLTDPRPQKHGDEEGNQDLVIHPRYRDKESLNSQHEETNIPLSTDGQPQDPDISQLEMVYITGDPKNSSFVENITYNICGLKKIHQQKNFILLPDRNDPSNMELCRCIWLPRKEEATKLAQMYFSSTTYMFHVIHIPSVESLLDNTYEHLISQKMNDPSHIALLLSIFAATSYVWSPDDLRLGLFSTVQEAHEQAKTWSKYAVDLIEYSCRVSEGSKELVQAIIIISFFIVNLEGISVKYRTLISTAIAISRGLSFHHTKNLTLRQLTPVVAEVSRRIWWYLAATDWMLAGMGGPQEGTYTINPAHMEVNKPMHINDYDITEDCLPDGLPRSQPSTMSYFLERVRLAEICRDATDCVPFTISKLEDINYDRVLEIDNRFTQFLGQLPPFFVLHCQSGDRFLPDNIPGIVVQRYVINFLSNSRRCKLHTPFLRHSSSRSFYSRSRQACLEASRQIILTEKLLENEDISFVLSRMRFSGTVHSLCMAIIILALDLCFHKNTPDYNERMHELRDACQILNQARNQSFMVGKFLESLTDILRKYNLPLPVGNQDSHDSGFDGAQAWTSNGPSNDALQQEVMQSLTPDGSVFDEMWRIIPTDLESTTLNWEDLFLELD